MEYQTTIGQLPERGEPPNKFLVTQKKAKRAATVAKVELRLSDAHFPFQLYTYNRRAKNPSRDRLIRIVNSSNWMVDDFTNAILCRRC
ncbi:hypothetical protein OUZ56_002381 [Daphnia magna]|uniref:Uncharacterized protein n=1 Tax=Daphnia magna TaxID=35525 RepID=A0ABR0A5S6_9CRUS|nr:hypothetical protein OUZ56_002381 [Daphnia magna]